MKSLRRAIKPFATCIQHRRERRSQYWNGQTHSSAEFLEDRTLLSAADLDLSFGSAGLASTDFNSGDDRANEMAVDAQGRIIVAGSSNGDWAIARFMPDGQPDGSFGVGGQVMTDFGSAEDLAGNVTVQTDGKIVAVGSTGLWSDLSMDFAVARYNVDGSLDQGFGNGGRVVTAVSSARDLAWGVLVQPDGKVVVGGYANNSVPTSDVGLVRYNADGTLDSGFGINGIVTSHFSGRVVPLTGIDLQTDGKIVIGADYQVGGRHFAVLRYNVDGALDQNFGSNGLATASFSTSQMEAGWGDAIIQPDGSILISGVSDFGINAGRFAIAKFTASGSIDSTFGADGLAVADVTSGADWVRDIAVENDGSVVAVGPAGTGGGIVRFDANGQIDLSFDADDGIVQSEIVGKGVVILPTGKFLVAGDADINGSSDFAVARYGDSSAGTMVSLTSIASSDGLLEGRDSTYSAARNTTSGIVYQDFIQSGQQWWSFGGQFLVWRGAMTFDTSSIPDDATITSARLKIRGTNKIDVTNLDPVLHVVPLSVDDVTILEPQDFVGLGDTSLGSITFDAFSTTGYNVLELNETGLLQIDAAGFTSLGLRTDDEIAGTLPPTNGNNAYAFYARSAESVGEEPILEITYTQPMAVGEIHGTKFHDLDTDGQRDANEPGLAGWEIYIDGNENGRLDTGEATTTTLADDPATSGVDETGTYSLTGLADGTHVVREVGQQGYYQTHPGDIDFQQVGAPSAIGVGARFVTSGDLNGDGHLDLAIANDTSDDVALMFGNGDGTFANAVSLLAGNGPAGVVAVDMDGVGGLDLAVVNHSGDTIQVLLNDGGGSFTTASVKQTGDGGPFSIASGDFDGDGDVDLATASHDIDALSLFFNNGDGTLQDVVNIPVGDRPFSVIASDLNGDGDLDLAMANIGDNNVSILLNDGSGGFSLQSGVTVGTAPVFLSSGDIDGDGDQDLVSANQSSGDVSVLLNNGNATFATSISYQAGSQPRYVALGDLNADGYPDLTVTRQQSQDAAILLNNGDGTFTAPTPVWSGGQSFFALVEDLTGDNRPDLAIATRGSDLHILRNRFGQHAVTIGDGEIIENVDFGNLETNSPVPGTLAQWPMNGAAGSAEKQDNVEGTSAFDIVEVGSPTSVVGHAGASDGAYGLDGNSYLTVGDVFSPGSDAFTVEFWVNSTTTANSVVVGGTANGSRNFVTVGMINGSVFSEIAWFANGSPQSLGGSGSLINDGEWHKVTVDYYNDSVAHTDIYVDGQLDVTFDHTLTYNIVGLNDGWKIGALRNWQQGHIQRFYQGAVDDVRILNVQETPTEPGSLLPVDAQTVALWRMNGANGSIEKSDNATGNAAFDINEIGVSLPAVDGYDGTLNGAYDLDSGPDHLSVNLKGADYGTESTIEALVYYEANGQAQQIYNDWDWHPWKNVTLWVDANGHLNAIRYHDTVTNGSPIQATSIEPMISGRWYYVAMTSKVGESTKVFIDGELAGESNVVLAAANTINSTFNGATIGASNYHGDVNNHWVGRIDEVRISNIRRTDSSILSTDEALPQAETSLLCGPIPGMSVATAIAFDNSGRALISGQAADGTDTSFAVARRTADGLLDRSFGVNGIARIDFGSPIERANELVIQPDGKIVLAGYVDSSHDFALARFNADGLPDDSFGSGGKVTHAISGAHDAAWSVVLQHDGKIVVGGYANNSGFGSSDFAIARFEPNGQLDSGFGSGGVAVANYQNRHDTGEKLLLHDNGDITLIGGSTVVGGQQQAALLRLDSLGDPVGTFGNAGISIVSTPNNFHALTGVEQTDGSIVFAGRQGTEFAVGRVDSNGVIDATFGNGGITVTTTPSNLDSDIQDIFIDTDGSLVAGGYVGSPWDFALVRYSKNGVLDESIGTAGLVSLDFDGGTDRAYGIARSAGGPMIAVGSATIDGQVTAAVHEFAIAALPKPTIPGVTIITHGWQPANEFADLTEWTMDMARAIATRAGENASIYFHDRDFGGKSWSEVPRIDVTHDWTSVWSGNSNDPNGEIILVFDWTWESDDFLGEGPGWIQSAADNLFASLIDPPSELGVAAGALLKKPLHFIGHSRGAVLNSMTINRIGQHDANIIVDQFTSLDPHPWTLAEDPGFDSQTLELTTNINWADNYFRRDGIYEPVIIEPTEFDVNGVFVPGARNLELNEEKLDEFELDVDLDLGHAVEHSDVHLWYLATIDTESLDLESENLANEVSAGWWQAGEGWTNDSAGTGEPESGRENVGYAYSRIGGKDQPSILRNSWVEPTVGPLIINGDFSLGGNVGTEIPGWERHGGGGSGHLATSYGNTYLQLDSGDTRRTHNAFFIPENTEYLQFDLWVESPRPNSSLNVYLDDLAISPPIPLSTATDGFVPFELIVDDELRNRVHTLTFEIIAADTAPRVNIDNVRLSSNPMPVFGVDRWFATVSDNPSALESMIVTWTVNVPVAGEYEFAIQNLDEWTVTSPTTIRIDETNSVLLSQSGGSGSFTSQPFDLDSGFHNISVREFQIPITAAIDELEFELRRTSGGFEIDHSATFVADYQETNLETFEVEIGGEATSFGSLDGLIDFFAPVLHFEEGEQFINPVSASRSLQADAEVRGLSMVFKSGASDDYLDLSQFAGSQVPNTEAAIYASVLQCTVLHGDCDNGELAINYYFHYPRSNWADFGGQNTHEGDWEGFTIFLTQNPNDRWVPDSLALAQHVEILNNVGDSPQTDGGDIIAWETLLPDGSHPSLYIGLGGHATYAAQGITWWPNPNPFGSPNREDHLGQGSTFIPNEGEVHYLPRAGSVDAPDWLLYPGRWGNPDLDGDGDSFDGDAGPLGPVFQDATVASFGNGAGQRWLDPWSWSNGFNVVERTDDDGVADHVEDRVVTYSGSFPTTGDGNRDGIPDRNQPNVTSLPNAADGRYVTIAAPDDTNLAIVRANPNPAPANQPPPTGIEFPVGFFEFEIHDDSLSSQIIEVDYILPPGSIVNTFYKFGPEPDDANTAADETIPHWYEFLHDGITGARFNGNVITVSYVDGLRGDDDLQINGVIVDPGAPAFNVAPDIDSLTLDFLAIDEGSVLTLNGVFTDPTNLDTHTVTVDWDDANDALGSTFLLPTTGTLSVGDIFNSTTDAAQLAIVSLDAPIGRVAFDVGYSFLDDGVAPGNATVQDESTITVTVADGYGSDSSSQFGGSAFRIGNAGFDDGRSMTVDTVGNTYVTGRFSGTLDFDPGAGTTNLTSNAGSADIFVAKYNPSGGLLWARVVGGSGFDDPRSITIDGAGNVVVTGGYVGTTDFDPGPGVTNLTSQGIADVFVLKLDAAGDFLWARSMGGSFSNDVGQSVHVDAAGDIYVTGFFQGTADFDPGPGTSLLVSAGGLEAFVLRLDSAGNLIWVRGIGGTINDVGFDVAVDAAGNVYSTGYFGGTVDFDPGAGVSNLTENGSLDAYLWKLDSAGNFDWAIPLGSTAEDAGISLAVGEAGTVYAIGVYQGTVDFDPGPGVTALTSAGSRDVFVMKVDGSGSLIWARSLGGTDEDSVGSVEFHDGVVYTVGLFRGTADFDPSAAVNNLVSAGGADAFISQLDSNGDFLAVDALGGPGFDFATSIGIDGSGTITISGSFQSTADFDPGPDTLNLTSAGNFDVYVARFATGVQSPVVTVRNVAPDFEAGLDETLLPPQSGVFNRSGITFSDPGTLDVHEVTVNFGDGSGSQTLTLPVGDRVFALNHVYTADGVYNVNVTVDDDDAGSHVDTFEVIVQLNTPPDAQDDDVSTDEDNPLLIHVLADNGHGADSDAEGNLEPTLTVNLTSPAVGTLVNNNDSTFTFDPNSEFEILDAGDSVTVNFSYQIQDTFGETDSATARITVTGVNDAPVANADTDSTTENAVLTTNVLINDTDVDGDDDPSNFTLDSVSLVSTTGLSGSPAAAGLVNILGNQLVFDPGTDFDELDAGDTATVTVDYTMSDDSGITSSSTLVITVTGMNDAPVATFFESSSADLEHKSDNGEVSIVGAFADVDLSDTHLITVDWGDDSGLETLTSVDQLADTFNGNHAYGNGGIYTVVVTIDDGNGGIATATTMSVVTGVGLVDATLYIIGTNGRDHVNIKINEKKDELKVDVKLNQGGSAGGSDGGADRIKETFTRSEIRRIVAFLCDGDDHYKGGLDGGLDGGSEGGSDGGADEAISQIVFGGAGNDHIQGGRGNDLLFGGSGNDDLFGGRGTDILIGGDGQDKLKGGHGNDLLIGGDLEVDWENSLNLNDLDTVLTEWAFGDLVDAMSVLGSLIDDGDKDELKGEKGLDVLIGGYSDKLQE